VKYPFTLLEYAFHLFLTAKYDVYMALRAYIGRALGSSKISTGDAKRIQGELAMLDSFHVFNNIRKMGEHHRAALRFFGGGSSGFFTPRTHWTFGTPSILFMFWSEPGELDEELAAMDECIPVYYGGCRRTSFRGGGSDARRSRAVPRRRGRGGVRVPRDTVYRGQ
jgi:LuxR family maltose regulon positive regulatory protein